MKVRQYLRDLGIDVRIGVTLKRKVKWTIFEDVWYEHDLADSFETTRAVFCSYGSEPLGSIRNGEFLHQH
jgi:hypothetical protein